MRILIVEDEIKIRRGMAKLIGEHTDHTIVGEAKNGLEGLEMTALYEPDLIITDIKMPVMNGLEMIQELHRQGTHPHFVILSGYSEFGYAKQAIQYGVDDYLIKPLAPEDVTNLLDTIQKKILKELSYKIQAAPEKALRDFLVQGERDRDTLVSLSETLEFPVCDTYRLICTYTGSAVQEEKKRCLNRFDKLGRQFSGHKFYYFFLEHTREFICLMADRSWELVKEELEHKLSDSAFYNPGWVWTENVFDRLDEIQENYKNARKQYPYGMVLGNRRFINQNVIDHYIPEVFNYPAALEYQIQSAFYSEKRDEAYLAGRQFMACMTGLKVKPDQIKEGYMKMAHFMLSLYQEGNQRVYEQLQNLNLMNSIGTAVTRKELEDIFSRALRIFASGLRQKENISNYTIKRAIDYIRNHYQDSISLEAVASNLDITPEYLSTLFNREVGQNFSVFLKKFRISHAKRLLKGTDKKIYEIAREVGYSDAKYFNRVFKEEEGLSPGDYRSLN